VSSLEILKQFWGYTHFRPPQDEIIQTVIEKRDVLAILPTGGGKSICFQVPALMQEGVCLVITPLIALMQDQVKQLKQRGIAAVAVHAGMQLFEVVGEGVFTVEQSKVFVQVLFCVPNIEQDSQSPQDQVSALQDGVQA